MSELANVTVAMEAETKAREVFDHRKWITGETMRRARADGASLRAIAEAASVSYEEVRRRTTREPAAA